MRLFRALLFILCLPAMIWYAPLQAESKLQQAHVRHVSNSWASWSPWQLLNHDTLSYDKIIDFVWEVAYGNTLEKALSQRQMNEVTEFMIALARHGVRDDDLEGKAQLEEDITRLRSGEYDTDPSNAPEGWWFSSLNKQGCPDAPIIPAVLYGFEKPQIIRSGWVSHSWKQTKKFIKKNKKVIIVSAVVVVAATVIIIATGGTGTAPALEGGGAAIGGAAASDKRDRDKDEKQKRETPVNKPGEVYVHDNPEDCKHLPTAPNPPQGQITSTPQLEPIPDRSTLLKESIARQSTILKEELSENTIIPDEPLNIPPQEQPSFWYQAVDKARETGSTLAHTFVDGTVNFLESSGRIGWALEDDYQTKREPFDEFFNSDVLPVTDQLHNKIDQSFHTNYAGQYGSAAREMQSPDSINGLLKELGKDVVFCFVPIPGSQLNKPAKIAKTAKAIVEVSKAAGVVKGTANAGAAVGSALTTPTPTHPTPTTNTPQVEVQTPVAREKGNISVYRSFNETTGEVNYVGITNNIARRHGEHFRSKGIDIIEIEGLTNLTKYDAKSVEQSLIEIHLLEKEGGTLTNRINSIAKTNPKYAESVSRGAEILKEIEYDRLEEFIE